MIGDEQLQVDANWKNWETLQGGPTGFGGRKSPTGRYTFTTGRHYQKTRLQRQDCWGRYVS